MKYIALGSNGPYARQVVWELEVPRSPAGYKGSTPGEIQVNTMENDPLALFMSHDCL